MSYARVFNIRKSGHPDFRKAKGMAHIPFTFSGGLPMGVRKSISGSPFSDKTNPFHHARARLSAVLS